jgi:hypothetical protein
MFGHTSTVAKSGAGIVQLRFNWLARIGFRRTKGTHRQLRESYLASYLRLSQNVVKRKMRCPFRGEESWLGWRENVSKS